MLLPPQVRPGLRRWLRQQLLGRNSEAEEGEVGKVSPVSGDCNALNPRAGPALAAPVKRGPWGSLSPHWPEGATSRPRPAPRPPVTAC